MADYPNLRQILHLAAEKQLSSEQAQYALQFNTGMGRSSAEFPGNIGYMFALEASNSQLVFGRLA